MYVESDISTWTIEDFDRNLAEVHRLFGSEPGTPEGDRLDMIMPLVGDYDDAHFPMLDRHDDGKLPIADREVVTAR